ncbi:MAG: ABC transporter ATP-binding protein [Planctomycetota bacterium]
MVYAIETFALTKKYRHQSGFKDLFRFVHSDEKIAVDNVTLKISEGEIFGLLGPNGSGKTTFLKLLCTLLLPSSGTARIYGHDIIEEDNKVKQLVGLVTGEERSFYWRLTGRQNLGFFATLHGLRKNQLNHQVGEVLELLDLIEVADIRVNEYSTGMKQKLAIARGLLGKPKILFLDEPTRGLDPIAAQSLLNMIRERIIDYFGNTIILTTHIMGEVERLCNRIAFLNHGRIVVCGNVDELKSSSRGYDKYFIKVKNFSEGYLQRLNQTNGVMSCSKTFQDNGVINVELRLVKNSLALSDVLKQMVQNRVEILSCTINKPSVEEMFRALLKDSKLRPTSQG